MSSAPASDIESRAGRPLPLTLLCLLGWLAVVVTGARVIARWDVFGALPWAHAIGATLALAVTAVSLLGYWRMRRWGLWVILAGTLARIAAGLVGALPMRPADFLWPAVAVLFGLIYYGRLR
jgi:hypothetical protein